MQHFVENNDPLLIMTWIMSQYWWTWTSEFMDYNIPLWIKRKVPAFETWFRKSRTTRIGTLFNETYSKINHLTLSVKNQSKWFMKLGTSNCVNYSIWNPKHSAQHAYHTSKYASSVAHAGFSVKETEVNRKIVKFTMDLLSIHEHVIKMGRPQRHRYGKKPREK